jgi:NADPH:quinone reductase
MRAVIYDTTGAPSVLRLVDRPMPEVGHGEVRVRVAVSGVNPTDWKARRGSAAGVALPEPRVPNQDGAGVVDAVGAGVADLAPGDDVWIWDAAYDRTEGTAQEFVVLPQRHVVRLPAGVGYDVGASLGIPALTAHRALTFHDDAVDRLTPGALAGRTVLVTGGAGAVGHAAVQLARWAGADVVATVSGPEKASLAVSAGVHLVIDYRREDVAARLRAVFPEGADIIVDVDAAANIAASLDCVAPDGSIAVYAVGGEPALTVPIRPAMAKNIRVQFLLTYTVSTFAKDAAVQAVTAAAADGALAVGQDAGLPLHRFTLDDAAGAHAAAERGVTGKVLIDVAET